MGGTNEASNMLKVNIAMHAFLHKLLFEEHGRWQDELAWKMLSGQISCQEALKVARVKGNLGNTHRLGKPKSDEERLKLRMANLGKKRSAISIENHRLALTGYKQTPEHTAKIAAANRGKKRKPYKKRTVH